jgi:hypothetical protein
MSVNPFTESARPLQDVPVRAHVQKHLGGIAKLISDITVAGWTLYFLFLRAV